ncbi:hypothetical protein BCV70DRAFT_154517 [Testicularia cyperi]|uniref:Uncharacterized protein n=1 Tax=Testicularia cyperi TaxID=1882483 RepID=A0A317Y0K2_9BASI|nr:hypothetical protein BCV70DRAFT_154517 [Testicularia cyperi]
MAADEYTGKTNAQIIDEAAQSLGFKSDYRQSDKFAPRTTVLSEQSGVNESGISHLPGAAISAGRTGQTGGGSNPQSIPPDEGGDGRSQRTGESSLRFHGPPGSGAEEKKSEKLKTSPGGFDASPGDVNQPRHQQFNEPVPRTHKQTLEQDQEAGARSHSLNS